MEVINKMVDNAVMDISAWSKVINEASKSLDGLNQSMGSTGHSRPSTAALHRKAVVKRKKKKRGGHK